MAEDWDCLRIALNQDIVIQSRANDPWLLLIVSLSSTPIFVLVAGRLVGLAGEIVDLVEAPGNGHLAVDRERGVEAGPVRLCVRIRAHLLVRTRYECEKQT